MGSLKIIIIEYKIVWKHKPHCIDIILSRVSCVVVRDWKNSKTVKARKSISQSFSFNSHLEFTQYPTLPLINVLEANWGPKEYFSFKWETVWWSWLTLPFPIDWTTHSLKKMWTFFVNKITWDTRHYDQHCHNLF